MSERVIDTMIAKVRDRAQARQRERREELERRRTEALRRIGQAVVDHGLPIAQSADLEAMLAARLQEAQRARISEAEAMADLAEFEGDLDSDLYWWEVKTSEGTILWKGYTKYLRLARVRFSVSDDGRKMVYASDYSYQHSVHMDVNVRRACYGAIVASLYVSGEGVGSVGVSEGPGASVESAVVEAYLAYFRGKRGTELDAEHVPGELLDSLVDSEEQADVESAHSSAETHSQTSRREPDEKGETE
jgi:hypothetical protein